VHQIYNTFPASWRSLVNNTRRRHGELQDEVYVDVNKWVPISNITLKILTNSFKPKSNLNINEHLQRKHDGIVIENLIKNPFLTIRNIHKDVKIRNLNYKMLHNIYPTMHHLFKWKIKETENCSICNCKETLKHATYDCRIATETISSLCSVVKNRYRINSNVTLNYENILFGVSSTRNTLYLRAKEKVAIDVVITLIKQRLILQRENKVEISIDDVNSIFEERKNIERYIAVKNRSLINVNSWGTMM